MRSLVAILFLAVATSAATLPDNLGGRNTKILDGRIVGGSDITIQQAPHQISLQIRGSHACGGSIISTTFVVTAAHCTDGQAASSLTVRAGSTVAGSGGTVYNVRRINQNPSYSSRTTDYDISILELSTPLSFSSSVAAIGLPAAGATVAAGTNVQVTGWGVLNENSGAISSRLQSVTVQIVSLANCRTAYGSSSITARMLCAGVNGGGKDACQGDSGGPLVTNGVLVGIVSWGIGCARPNYPGVYSDVASLRSYIKDITNL